ncbi:NUDIX domain-containing protein [Chloroflexota bacterium]
MMAAKIIDVINYCPRCGTPVIQAERAGRLRPVCPHCGWIYFADPKVAVAALITRENKVLLVRRTVDPQRGLWALPAGYVDAGEDPVSALERECLEETGLTVRVTGLLDVLNGQEHPNGAHIIIVYRAEVVSGSLRPDDDVDRADYFRRNNLPALAFTSTRKLLDMQFSSQGEHIFKNGI